MFDPRASLDSRRYPLEGLDTDTGTALVERCRRALDHDGMFNLDGLVLASALASCVRALMPSFAQGAFTHRRRHNIYFSSAVDGLPADHPALREVETVNHTLCADQLAGTLVAGLYGWEPLASFLARVLDKPRLYLMDDPLARVNVMAYHAGEALNWHFDRSEFTVTLLLQAPERGGAFQYRRDLRTDHDPNFDGVGRLLEGRDDAVRTLALSPGTLNVFRGRHTAHRVTPVEGSRARIVAVFSYYERAGVRFSAGEQTGFYGRTLV